MKKNRSGIILITVVVVGIVIGTIWYYNYGRLKDGYANMTSKNWPEFINNNKDTSLLSKAFLIGTYGDGKTVPIDDITVFLPDENDTYIQINYGDNIYVANSLENTTFVFRNTIIDGGIDTSLDYTREDTHIEQPSTTILSKAQPIINLIAKEKKEFNFQEYIPEQFSKSADEANQNLYIRRDGGFSELTVSGWNSENTKMLSIAILFQDENIIGLLMQTTE